MRPNHSHNVWLEETEFFKICWNEIFAEICWSSNHVKQELLDDLDEKNLLKFLETLLEGQDLIFYTKRCANCHQKKTKIVQISSKVLFFHMQSWTFKWTQISVRPQKLFVKCDFTFKTAKFINILINCRLKQFVYVFRISIHHAPLR